MSADLIHEARQLLISGELAAELGSPVTWAEVRRLQSCLRRVTDALESLEGTP